MEAFDLPQIDRALIVANGPSVEGVCLDDVPESVHIIAVNGAVEWLPIVDSFFTLDPSVTIRALMADPRPGVAYYAAVPDDYGMEDAKQKEHRAPRDAHVIHLKRQGRGWTIRGVLGAV